MKLALLIGANHAHQLPGKACGQAEAFSSFVETVAQAERVDLIAEEMSIEALVAGRLLARLFKKQRSVFVQHTSFAIQTSMNALRWEFSAEQSYSRDEASPWRTAATTVSLMKMSERSGRFASKSG